MTSSAVAVQAGTLEDVRSSGVLQCGVDAEIHGYSASQSDEKWTGLSVDFCRGLAAAVIGNASKVIFTTLTADERVEALQSGEIDVLVSALPVALATETRDGVMFVEPLYLHDEKVFAPAVRQGDDQWFLTVRWLRHFLLQNGDKTCADFNAFAGLEKDWACRVAKDVGSYSDFITRNFANVTPDSKNQPLQQRGGLWAPQP